MVTHHYEQKTFIAHGWIRVVKDFAKHVFIIVVFNMELDQYDKLDDFCRRLSLAAHNDDKRHHDKVLEEVVNAIQKGRIDDGHFHSSQVSVREEYENDFWT